jgi:N-acetylglucosamine-6-phosphate deacetylase
VFALINGALVLEHEVRTGLALLYDKKIIDIVPMAKLPAGVKKIDATGLFIAPGFINMHIHGCAGADVMDGTAKALNTISRFQATTGVTAFLPTTMTYDFPKITKALNNIRTVRNQGREPGAKIIGAYLEGPFISNAYKGAQKAEHIFKADFSKIAPFSDIISFVLLAPETLTVKELQTFTEKCHKKSLRITLGHSAATYEEGKRAIDKYGCQHITHLFNGMAPLHHRSPGLVGAGLLTDATCEIICDNIHLHPATQKMAYTLKGSHKLILITDSMRACGLPDGVSELGGQTVYVKNGKATLKDGTIAGSILTMDKALANMSKNAKLTIPEAVAMVTSTPAKELGEDSRRGFLKSGLRADFTLFDKKWHIHATIIGGKMVYKNI